jgi:glycosyltransferase involved in cell wall biosynthesis
MRIFMLGWEFPPFISGGLGTACYGLTKALSRQGTQVTFVLPKTVDSDYSSHVKLLSPQAPQAAAGDQAPASVSSSFEMETPVKPGEAPTEFEHVSFRAVPSRLSSPYPTGAASPGSGSEGNSEGNSGGSSGGGSAPPISFINPATSGVQAASPPPEVVAGAGGEAGDPLADDSSSSAGGATSGGGGEYFGDLTVEAQRYAQLCVALASGEDFDVVHAHDWFTFPAGLAVARATGKPLVVHVHSTEFDRCGDHAHSVIVDFERQGCHAADKVIAVSRRTKTILADRYDVPDDKIEVVYNGIENGPMRPDLQVPPKIHKDDKVVLFLGRVTMQKGPEYFIQAAKRVLEKVERVKFVIAGTGDKIQEMIERVARAGIGHKVVFTGFLRGDDVEKVFKMADVYVMPSVSEPFGIAPLEAISHDVPVIISKQSGVSEVLDNALKVDFWDTDEMANKIIAVLRPPPLGATLREHADLEVRRLTWGGAAEKCLDVYRSVLDR